MYKRRLQSIIFGFASFTSYRTGPGAGRGHVHPLPHAAHRARHPHRCRGQHHLHPLPRRQAEALCGAAQGKTVRSIITNPLTAWYANFCIIAQRI